MNLFGKHIGLWIVIGVLLVLLFNMFQGSSQRVEQEGIPYSEFVASVQAGN